MERAAYLWDLRLAVKEFGSENIIYKDESGFEADVRRNAGWAMRGTKIYGDVKGGRNPRTNLIMAQRRKSRQIDCK